MNYTEYKYPQDEIDAAITEKKANLNAIMGFSKFADYALKAIADYLNKKPTRYRDYGVYWWALKDLLNSNGYLFGNETDAIIKSVYIGKNNEETIIMADIFRAENLAENMVGTNRFMVNDDGEFYTLFDDDME